MEDSYKNDDSSAQNMKDREKKYSFTIRSGLNTKETNIINTSKYNWYNFLPKILFEQFSKPINLYFVIISIFECINVISLTNGYPLTLLPLSFVILINGCKDFIEDMNKKEFDETENNREIRVFDNAKKCFVKKQSSDIRLGDLIKIKQDEIFPADLILIASKGSEDENLSDLKEEDLGLCYIESKNLDGETNLKYKQANIIIASKYLKEEDFLNLNGLIECTAPNEQLNDFVARYYENPDDKNNFINIENHSLLLRGCCLKQTSCIYGIAVYLGHNTKMIKNFPTFKNKKASIESIMYSHISMLIIFDIVICLFQASMVYIDSKTYRIEVQREGDHKRSKLIVFFSNFGRFILFLTNIVPISLLVSLEIIKFIQGKFMSWDVKLWDKETLKHPIIQSSTLNEDLGKVGFIFSDKTGTLTKNLMTFKKMSIGNFSYGQDFFQKNLLKLNDKYGKIENFDFFDNEFMDHIKDDDHENYNNIKYFLLCICICNSVFTEKNKKNELIFEGSSPDEIALINAARYFKYIFLKRKNGNKILLEINGIIEEFTINYFLEYSSERKCMSVIVTDSEGRIFVFTKGADNIIREKISVNKEQIETTNKHLIDFAKKGLRTLMLAYKEITSEELADWEILYNKVFMGTNREKLNEVYDEIEKDFTLLGCTAIEDQLEDKVSECIKDFIDIGIKVWVLTGDKPDTSVSVAFSSKLIDHEYRIFEFSNLDTKEMYQSKISEYLEQIEFNKKGKFGLILQTDEFKMIESDTELSNKFFELSIKCNSVICCRMSPKQKADLVKIVRLKMPQIITLAIGDGANDVNMITSAHIGVGILGKEGLQAAKVSDYAIAKFSFLRRLLFVHGRECYRKNSFIVIYTYYKNIIVIGPQIAYGYFCIFSSQSVYESRLYESYNIFFTSLTLIWYAIADKEFTYKKLEKEPSHYIRGIKGKGFSSYKFWKGVIYGLLQGMIILFAIAEVHKESTFNGGKSLELTNIGSYCLGVCVLVVNIKILLSFHSYTGIEVCLSLASIFIYYISIFSLSHHKSSSYFGSYRKEIQSKDYYLSVFGYVISILLIDYGTSHFVDMMLTKENNLIQEKEENIDETKIEEDHKELLEPVLDTKPPVNFFYMGSAFSQEPGQARHIAKKLV